MKSEERSRTILALNGQTRGWRSEHGTGSCGINYLRVSFSTIHCSWLARDWHREPPQRSFSLPNSARGLHNISKLTYLPYSVSNKTYKTQPWFKFNSLCTPVVLRTSQGHSKEPVSQSSAARCWSWWELSFVGDDGRRRHSPRVLCDSLQYIFIVCRRSICCSDNFRLKTWWTGDCSGKDRSVSNLTVECRIH